MSNAKRLIEQYKALNEDQGLNDLKSMLKGRSFTVKNAKEVKRCMANNARNKKAPETDPTIVVPSDVTNDGVALGEDDFVSWDEFTHLLDTRAIEPKGFTLDMKRLHGLISMEIQ